MTVATGLTEARANELALVLIARNVPFQRQAGLRGWELWVSLADAPTAAAELTLYRHENAKAVGSLVSGYAPVRAHQPPPTAPVIVDAPALPPPPNATGFLDRLLTMKPDEMMQLALMLQNVFGMVKGAMGGMQGGGAGGGAA